MKLMVFVQKNVDVSGNHIDAAEVSIFTLLQQHGSALININDTISSADTSDAFGVLDMQYISFHF
jgi:hypothetical protein